VLLAILNRPQGLCLLLTRRTLFTRNHKGQVSFPGGAADDGDASPWVTALREAREEAGLDPAMVTPLGALTPLYVVASNFYVHPFLGWVERPPEAWQISVAEVAEVIEAPLDNLLDPAALSEETWWVSGHLMRVPFYRFREHRVWGATAMMFSELEVMLAALAPAVYKEDARRSTISPLR